MSTEIEILAVEQLLEEISVPCDYDRLLHCGPAAAEWVMVARCGCGTVGNRLVCPGCKDIVLQAPDGLSCPSGCGEVFIPARKAFTIVERL